MKLLVLLIIICK